MVPQVLVGIFFLSSHRKHVAQERRGEDGERFELGLRRPPICWIHGRVDPRPFAPDAPRGGVSSAMMACLWWYHLHLTVYHPLSLRRVLRTPPASQLIFCPTCGNVLVLAQKGAVAAGADEHRFICNTCPYNIVLDSKVLYRSPTPPSLRPPAAHAATLPPDVSQHITLCRTACTATLTQPARTIAPSPPPATPPTRGCMFGVFGAHNYTVGASGIPFRPPGCRLLHHPVIHPRR